MTTLPYGDPTEWDWIPDAFSTELRNALERYGWTVLDAHETAVTVEAPGVPQDHAWYLHKPNFHGWWCYGVANEHGYCANPEWLYADAADPHEVAAAADAILLARYRSLGTWPSPKQAYATAPSVESETAWLAERRRNWATDDEPEEMREYRLRAAAALDRLALLDPGHDHYPAQAAECARELVLYDDVWGTGPSTGAAEADPRGYVRQEYATWLRADS